MRCILVVFQRLREDNWPEYSYTDEIDVWNIFIETEQHNSRFSLSLFTGGSLQMNSHTSIYENHHVRKQQLANSFPRHHLVFKKDESFGCDVDQQLGVLILLVARFGQWQPLFLFLFQIFYLVSYSTDTKSDAVTSAWQKTERDTFWGTKWKAGSVMHHLRPKQSLTEFETKTSQRNKYSKIQSTTCCLSVCRG